MTKRNRIATIAALVSALALTLIPGATVAQASNSSDSAAVLSAMNNFRASNGALPALKRNGYIDIYAQDLANVYASCGVTCIPDAKTSEDPPEGGTYFAFAEKATGSGRTTKISTEFMDDWGPQITDSPNYAAVGYVSKTSTDYAILVVATYASAPLDLMTPGNVTVSGTAQVGITLTAHPGTFSPTPDVYFYQWISGTNHVGSDQPTYVPQPVDIGNTIRVIVTGTKAGYQSSSDSSPSTAKVKFGSVVHPSSQAVTGSHNVGSTLSAGLGGWQSGTILTAQWLRSGHSIPGQEGGSYTLTAADKGKKVDVRITGNLTGYQTVTLTSHTSHETGNPLLTMTPIPAITGAYLYGQTLAAVPTAWGPGLVHLSYQWYRGSSKISGATKVTYKLGSGSVGKQVSVRVTGSEAGWASVTESSAAHTISAAEFGGSGGASITAPTTLKSGAKLTAHAGSWIPTPTSHKYVWYRDGVAISHATSSTYTLKSSDNGHGFSVLVEVFRSGYDSTAGLASTFEVTW